MNTPDNRKTICVDYNGVLDTYAGYNNGMVYPPRTGALEFLRSLQEVGYKVVILTSANVEKIRNWLAEYEMLDYVDEITNVKVPAIVYVDDRAIQFRGDFQDTLAQISSFRTYWEHKLTDNLPIMCECGHYKVLHADLHFNCYECNCSDFKRQT